LPDSRLGEAAWEVNLTYGGGVRTIVGYGSVGVPGGVAALGEASRRYGSLPWKEVVEPAMTIVETGFPLPSACHHYLESSADPVFGWEPHSRGTFIDAEGNLVGRGDTIRLPGLATTLETLAIKGPEEFYTGDLGHTIADYVSDHGGSLNRADMSAYKPIVRPSLQVSLDDWRIATNPPPAVGGATLAAMLMMMNDVRHEGWDPISVKRLVEVQHAVTRYRHQHIDTSGEITAAVEGLLQMARDGTPPGASGSTVHTSAADRSAIGCSITMSSGYGSGALPPGTGIWLNNCLGEIELLPGGIEQAQPGRRLPSNMAPTVARTEDGRVLSTGSPGADRITTAMLQGRSFDEPSMYFGGVAVAEWGPASGFVIAADPRRQGGTAVGGA
jgi:gamma-glutamyltranspeptidase/glutathione hydrolase